MTDLFTKVRHASNVKPTCYYKTFTLRHRALSIHYFHSEILFLFVIIRSTIYSIILTLVFYCIFYIKIIGKQKYNKTNKKKKSNRTFIFNKQFKQWQSMTRRTIQLFIYTLIQWYMINEISRLNDGNNCESLFYWSTIYYVTIHAS